MTKFRKKAFKNTSGKCVDFDNVCRLCLGNRLLVPIFGADGLKQQLAMKIQKHLLITVKEVDEMPQKLCYHCASTLIEWNNLVSTVSITESRLLEIASQKDWSTVGQQNEIQAPVSKSFTDVKEYEHPKLFKQKISNVYKNINAITSKRTLSDQAEYTETEEPVKSAAEVLTNAKLEITVEENVLNSLALEEDGTVALKESLENNPLGNEHITSIVAGNSSNSSSDKFVLKESSNNLEEPLNPDDTGNIFELDFAFHEEISVVPSTEKVEGLSKESQPGRIEVYFYNDNIFQENLHCLPCNLGQVNQMSNSEIFQDGRSDGTATVCGYDDLPQSQTPDDEPSGQEFLKVILASQENYQESTSEDVSTEVHMKDGESSSNNVVIEYLTQDNQELLYNQEVKLELNSNTNTEYFQCSTCKKIFNLESKCVLHMFSAHVQNENSPLQNESISLNSKRCLCTYSVSKLESFCPVQCHDESNHSPNENVHLDIHRRKHVGEESIGEKKACKNQLEQHQRTHRMMPLSCTVCNKTFQKRSLVKAHERTHRNTRFLCSLCGKELKNRNSLAQHIITHSSVRPFKCETCGKDFKRKTQLRLHVGIHSKERNFTCEVCASRFRSAPLLKQHQLSHSGARPFECNVCGAAFNRSGNLTTHKKRHAPGFEDQKIRKRKKGVIDGTRLECPFCNKGFNSILTLKYHVSRHTGNKYPFDCDYCDKRFLSLVSYRTHIRTHTGERPYMCTECDKTFRSAASLKQHVASLHSDECPHECPSCDRKFKRLQSLIVHRRTHTGEKNHKCSECGRAFAERGDMLKHLRTHSNAKAVRLKPSLSTSP